MGSLLRVANRTLLALCGLLLAAGGGATLAAALGAFGSTVAAGPVLGPADRARITGYPWWWPASVAALSVVFLVALGWLLAQLGRARRRSVALAELGADGRSVARSAAMAEAMAAAMEDVPGVDRAAVVVAGRRHAPGLRVSVAMTRLAEPARLARELARGPVADLRRSVDRPDLPVEVTLRARRPPRRGGRREPLE